MTNMNSLDIQVRIWRIVEKLNCLGNEYANDLRLGKKCSLEHRNDILLLQGVLNILKCYQYLHNTPETLSVGQISNIIPLSVGTIGLNITSGGITITGDFPVNSDNAESDIINAINSYNSGYIASPNEDTLGVIDITGPCNARKLSYSVILGILTMDLTGMSGGICASETIESDNCFTEKQMQELLNRVNKKYKLNFAPIGATYTE